MLTTKSFPTWGYIVLAVAIMFLLGLSGVVFDKSDWIFLFLVLGIIILNIKLNKILKLLEGKKHEKK